MVLKHILTQGVEFSYFKIDFILEGMKAGGNIFPTSFATSFIVIGLPALPSVNICSFIAVVGLKWTENFSIQLFELMTCMRKERDQSNTIFFHLQDHSIEM